VIYRNIGTASYWASSKVKVTVNKLLLKRIAAVVSVSQHGRADFIRHYGFPQERVVYIPNGVDVTEFDNAVLQAARPALRRAWGLQEGDIALVNVGSLSPEKNQAELLRLTADLCASGLPIVLLLVGDGSLKQGLGLLSCHLGIAERVRFLGSRTGIPELLGAADLFVLTSKTEGMPGVLIEAGLAGLASVAYGVGGVAEVVAHEATGVVVPAGNYSELVAAVAQLSADHRARADMGQRAQQDCLERFDIANVALAYEQLFTQVLSGTGS
ncbi:MAG: glycosyltransferase family 4 protein, partial [Dehalococcoidia bacterium]